MALIVKDGYIVGTGYNGSPSGLPHCIDGYCPRLQEGSVPGSDYDNCISNHAEVNAIINSGGRDSIAGASLYINGQPCWMCAKVIANTGISRIVYTRDPDYPDYLGWENTATLMHKAEIELVHVPIDKCVQTR